MKRQILIAVAATLLASTAFAASTIDTTQRIDAIVAQQQRIRTEVQAHKNGWEDVPAATRYQVLRDQDRLFTMLEGKQVIGDLPADRQLEAANLLENIKAAVTGAEDQRKVCTRERKVGSNFTQRVCRTVAQIRKEREAARDGMDRGDQMRRMQPPQPGAR